MSGVMSQDTGWRGRVAIERGMGMAKAQQETSGRIWGMG